MISETQLQGYEHIRARLGRVQWEAWAALRLNGSLTRNELDQFNASHLYRGAKTANPPWSRRLVELERMGVAHRPTTKICTWSGQECDAWEALDAIPKRLAKRRKNPSRSDLAVAARWLQEIALEHEAQVGDLPDVVHIVIDWLEARGRGASSEEG